MKFKRYIIILVASVLLFGAVSFVDAAPCQESEEGVWNTDPSCTQQLIFEDPGVAELDICEYRIVSLDGSTKEITWISLGDCSGSVWTTPAAEPITVYINTDDPVTEKPSCKDDGEYRCIIYQRAQDNFGNKSVNYATGILSHAYNIDFSSPKTTIEPDGSGGWKYEDITFNLSCDDTGSGCSGDPEYGFVNAGDDCTEDSFDQTGVEGTISCFEGEEGCEKKVCYRSLDNASHQEDIQTSDVFQIDITAPRLDFFEINNTNYTGGTVFVDEGFEFTLVWEASDIGGSQIDYYDIFRGVDIDGDGIPSWSSWPYRQITDADSTSISFNMPVGTAWYGVHVTDKAGNCITENIDIDKKGHCDGGGVIKDSLDPGVATPDIVRITMGPIEVTVVENSIPPPFGCSETISCEACNNLGQCNTGSIVCGGDCSAVAPPSDTIPPVLEMVTAVVSPTSDTTPNYTFSSTEAGSITYGGDCSSSLDKAIADDNTITFNSLAEGLHDNCTIEVTDSAGNLSNKLKVDDFTIVAEVPPPSDENQPPTIQDTPISSPGLIIKAGDDAIFSANWTDPDGGEKVKLLVCKGVLVGASCDTQGAWCVSASFSTSNPATCTYTTISSDDGNNTYNAYICDDQATCSSGIAGSFNVDAVAPTLVIDLQNNGGSAIAKVNQEGQANDTLYIAVGDSTDNFGITEVRFSSDTSQNGIQEGGWTDWEQWNISEGNWNSTTKRKEWVFATSGNQEVWVELKDAAGNTAQGNMNFYVNFTPGSTLYRWDGSSYVCDQDNDCVSKLTNNWKNADFTRYVFDQDVDGSLSSCSWMATNLPEGARTPCINSSFNQLDITVGPTGACATEGINQCVAFVRNIDNNGSSAPLSSATYSVDWTDPVIQNNLSPITFQVTGSPITFSTSVSDNIELNYCWLYVDGSTAYAMTFHANSCSDPQLSVCDGGSICSACADIPISDTDSHSMQVICSDQYDIETSLLTGIGTYLNTISGLVMSVQGETLSVALSVDPTAGSINTKFNLSSQVTGSATGNTNFKFDCTNDGIFEYEIDDIDLSSSDPGWVTRMGKQTRVTAPDTFAVQELCQYVISNTYTASSLVERGIFSAQDTLDINIGVSDNPEAINLQDNSSSADYCFVSTPPIILSWTFSDINPGDTQSAYQVQISTIPGFDSPLIDTGKVQSVNSEFSPLNIFFDQTYFWQVSVWDSLDNISSFAQGNSFVTPIHAYPAPDFTWTPVFPLPEEEIQFTDKTVFASGSLDQSWLWSFGDGTTSTQQNPVHTYNDASAYIVDLKSTDDVGSCGGLGDLDGDGIPNEQDPDIDGDGILNEDDDDIDGDGILNEQDSSPSGGGSGGAGGSGTSGGSSGGSGGSGASIINVTLPFPDYQEISPF